MRRGYGDLSQDAHSSSQKIFQKKSLGQVFLNTDWPVNRVVEQAQDLGIKKVLEIGPGNGILTTALSNAGITVTAIEKDDRFAARINDLIKSGSLPNTDVINEDILQFDLGAWISSSGKTPVGVVGNIPYNISTPILM
jgi:16S rRNA (adenine1518-N6/adenine1519-N6)-dimethyltransferase